MKKKKRKKKTKKKPVTFLSLRKSAFSLFLSLPFSLFVSDRCFSATWGSTRQPSSASTASQVKGDWLLSSSSI